MSEPHLSFLPSLSSSIEVSNLILSSVIDTMHVSMYGGHFTIQDVIVMVFDKLNYMMQMDARKRWMYGDRRTSEYVAGLKKCTNVAEANKVNAFRSEERRVGKEC